MKESYIKLPNITVSKLQDVVDYLDENNIEYIEDYKEEVELNKYKKILDKIKDLVNKSLVPDSDYIEYEYGAELLRQEFLELLEEIE